MISGGKNFLYKPRAAGGGFHKHADKIDKEKMSDLMKKLEYYLHFFGYAKDDREKEGQSDTHVGPNGVTYNKFQFYDYQGKAKQENKDAYMDYLNVNEKMLNKRIEERKTGNYSKVTINKPGEGFSMLTEKNMIQYTEILPLISIKQDTKRI